MAYRLTKKNFAVTRVMPKGPERNKRLEYMHVNRNGSTATDGRLVARVALQSQSAQPISAYIYPKAVLTKAEPKERTEEVVMDGELPAMTTAEHAVVNLDALFPKPEEQVAEFTCDAAELLTLLKCALDVSEDADNTIKLRICNSKTLGGKILRIDTLTFPGDQSFCGVMKGVNYNGNHVAGDPGADVSPAYDAEEKPTKGQLPLKLDGGRKFRG